MIAALQGRAAQVLIGLALLVGLLLAAWLVLDRLDTMIERAEQAAIEKRDAYWTAEIERGNAEANRRIADQAKAALAIETTPTPVSGRSKTNLPAWRLRMRRCHMAMLAASAVIASACSHTEPKPVVRIVEVRRPSRTARARNAPSPWRCPTGT
ncbi:hypothetical protein [Shinella sp.]|uniref:hypothetical protein n=1 Tax=Shinella sp. TaxID=1870904 RepID=UPI00258B60D3|nr:hypothetical protein [Shinella sp.]MCW5708688.1 hypothetical protein [Shinella sp.]